tara:strand:+ start:101 stop:265 length:165 start_codon:yes stop_codon:yes gene_type:complete
MNSLTQLDQIRKQIEQHIIKIAKLKKELCDTENQLYKYVQHEQEFCEKNYSCEP